MSRHSNALRVILRIALLVVGIAASPQAVAVREGPPVEIDVSSLDGLRQALEQATPGSIIRLAAGTYEIFADDPPFRIKGVQGQPDRPIVLRGTRGAVERARPTIIDGGRRLGPTLAIVESFRHPGSRSHEIDESIEENQYRTRQAVNCFVFEDAAYLVIEELTVRNCWPTSFVLVSSRYVTVRAATIVGSTYAVFVNQRSDHVLIEDTVWTQDDSGYSADESGSSGRVDLEAKPGRMWDTVPWGVSHHGTRAHLNGGLVGAFGAPGSIVVRRDIIRNAYNGIRLRANRCERPPCNVNIEIYDSDFQFIRDNPVEPEDQAVNWWIFHNRIRNAHGWISLDGVSGGPMYLYGNVGWFDDKPSRSCVQRDWAADRTLRGPGRYEPTSENECNRSRTGRVFKLGLGTNELNEPIYAFNNSIYIRAPILAGGRSKFRAWNNATLFCEPDAAAPGMCIAELLTDEPCVQSAPGAESPFANRFPLGSDRVPYIDCFAPSPGDEASHSISSHPDFPVRLNEAGYPFHGSHGDPGFVNAPAGNFRLRADSIARGKGCVVTAARDGSLTCSTTPAAADVGAYSGDRLVEGPDFVYRGDEQPRVMRANWRMVDGSAQLEVVFSTPIEDPPAGTRMSVRLAAGNVLRSEPCQRVRAIALDCRFANLAAVPPATATLLVPRSIRSAEGRPVTLWAARPSRVELQ